MVKTNTVGCGLDVTVDSTRRGQFCNTSVQTPREGPGSREQQQQVIWDLLVPYSHLSCANWSHCQDLRAGDTCCVDSCFARISSCQETGKASGGLSFWLIINFCPEVSALMG